MNKNLSGKRQTVLFGRLRTTDLWLTMIIIVDGAERDITA